jgi:hypothetical protein
LKNEICDMQKKQYEDLLNKSLQVEHVTQDLQSTRQQLAEERRLCKEKSTRILMDGEVQENGKKRETQPPFAEKDVVHCKQQIDFGVLEQEVPEPGSQNPALLLSRLEQSTAKLCAVEKAHRHTLIELKSRNEVVEDLQRQLREVEEVRTMLQGEVESLSYALSTTESAVYGQKPCTKRQAQFAEHALSKASPSNSAELQLAIDLTTRTKEAIAKEHLTDHDVITRADGNQNTTVGISYDTMSSSVVACLVGGPAFTSKRVFKGDVILAIDGRQVAGPEIQGLLKGVDKPGSTVKLTLQRISVPFMSFAFVISF